MMSLALWIPLLWILIIGSRPVSTWFGGGLLVEKPQDYLEGSPLDASVFLLLIVAGLCVLVRRKVSWGRIFASNRWFFAFFFYYFVSIMWSDYPFLSFKRWTKDFGNVIMILVILTEKDHVEAIKAIFLRYSYVAIPLSVVFIKYFPELGRYVDRWTWEFLYCGIATEKNALGPVAFISGLFLIWDLIEMRMKRQRERSEADEPAVATGARAPVQRRGGGRVAASSHCDTHGAARSARRGDAITAGGRTMDRSDLASRVLLLLMVIWLIIIANSSTSLLCLIIGTSFLFLMRCSFVKRQIRYLGTYCLAVAFLLFFLYSVVPDILADFIGMLGRDATLTGRTDLWTELLNAPINPLLGRGYQSFWLGPEASLLWEKYYFHPNQAHNGYLETYLNGGLLGVCLLIAMIVSTGGKLKKQMLLGSSYETLCFSFFIIVLFSNWTEATFNRLCLVWILLIVSALNYPRSHGYMPQNLARSRNDDIIRSRPKRESKLPVASWVIRS
jgi:hypothetical protein